MSVTVCGLSVDCLSARMTQKWEPRQCEEKSISDPSCAAFAELSRIYGKDGVENSPISGVRYSMDAACHLALIDLMV